jgi:TRAP-type transport system small permease protein
MMIAVRALSIGFAYLGAFAIAFMMIVTVADVFGRLLFGRSIDGAYDLVQLTLVVAVYSAMPEAFRQGAQITVDLVDRLAGPRLTRGLSIAALTLSLAAVGFLTILSIQGLFEAARFGDVTADLGLAKTWHWIGVFGGLSTSCLTILALLSQSLRGSTPAAEPKVNP